jgi:acyl-CoA thioesterase FadM
VANSGNQHASGERWPRHDVQGFLLQSRPMIERAIRTRGYECDARRTVSLPNIFSYLEHLRWEWIQQPELGLLSHLHQGCFFVVHEQTAEILRRVPMSTEVVLRGSFEHVGRSRAVVRHSVVRASDDALLVDARVTGCWLGANRRLARIPDETRAAAAVDVERSVEVAPDAETADRCIDGHSDSFLAPPEQVYRSRGLELPLPEPDALSEDASEFEVIVRDSDLDIFAHVNASNWLRFVDDARLDAVRSGRLGPLFGGAIQRAAIHHPKEACQGDRLVVRTWSPTPDTLAALVFKDGVVACRAAFGAVATPK